MFELIVPFLFKCKLWLFIWHCRAVALFFKDHVPSAPSDEQPGKFSLTRILEGKVRKQAARMFFETMVIFRIFASVFSCSFHFTKQEAVSFCWFGFYISFSRRFWRVMTTLMSNKKTLMVILKSQLDLHLQKLNFNLDIQNFSGNDIRHVVSSMSRE